MKKKNVNESLRKIMLGIACVIFAFIFWLAVEFNQLDELSTTFFKLRF